MNFNVTQPTKVLSKAPGINLILCMNLIICIDLSLSKLVLCQPTFQTLKRRNGIQNGIQTMHTKGELINDNEDLIVR